MQTLVIENKDKRFELILEHDKDGVKRAIITYDNSIPLSNFINCNAIAKISGCGSEIPYEVYHSNNKI